MNRNRMILIGVLAFSLAGVISYSVYRMLRVYAAAGKTDMATVVVAAVDIPVGTRLAEKDLRLTKVPRATLPAGFFESIPAAVGRGVLVPLSGNEVVLETKVAGENAGAGLPSMIPSGMRAVSVKVNDVVSVAGFVGPGTHVDVIVTGNPQKSNDPGDVTTTTVLENVPVLAAGKKLQRDEKGEAKDVPVITLLVSPEDAQTLTLASAEGRIQLSLRNPLDSEPRSPNSLQNAQLYGIQKKQSAPKTKIVTKTIQPPPVATYVVEMIRGEKRDVTKF
jgi:pilus assembly protein CpaB